MQCEICGKETANPSKIDLDGSHLMVCSGCSDYGIKENLQRTQPFTSQKHKTLFEMDDEIKQGYGKVIMQARQKKGLTIDDLGKAVFEKSSLLHRIEREDIKPSPKLTKKIEAELGIKITGVEENEA